VSDADVLAAARAEAAAAVDELVAGAPGGLEEATIAEAARSAVRRALGRVLGSKPMTTVTVVREPPLA
jgi:hypothetical protein